MFYIGFKKRELLHYWICLNWKFAYLY